MDRFKNFLHSPDIKKDVFLACLFLVFVIAILFGHGSGSKGAARASAAPSASPSASPPAVQPSYPAQTPNSSPEIPEENFDPTQDSTDSTKPPVISRTLTVQGDSEEAVEDQLNSLIKDDWTFRPAEGYAVRFFGDFAGVDERYATLYSFSAETQYDKATDLQYGGLTLHKNEGDTAYVMAYVEKGGESWKIHRLVVDGHFIVNDGQVPAGADSLK